jgi:hypothetical protein
MKSLKEVISTLLTEGDKPVLSVDQIKSKISVLINDLTPNTPDMSIPRKYKSDPEIDQYIDVNSPGDIERIARKNLHDQETDDDNIHIFMLNNSYEVFAITKYDDIMAFLDALREFIEEYDITDIH